MSSDFNKDALLRSAKRINVSYFKEQQEDAINAIWQWWQSQSISFTLSGYAGTGKALLDDTKVLTINGWHSIGDIKVGDKVAVPTGGFYPVSAVYHHSDRPLYKITFKDDFFRKIKKLKNEGMKVFFYYLYYEKEILKVTRAKLILKDNYYDIVFYKE